MTDAKANKNKGVLEVGSFIGGTYRVLDFIGQGGMGFVYKVEHLMMAKVLALKVLRSEQVSEEIWKRFRIEAQAIARLDHTNVVRIYDMSQTEQGLPYYTMDLLVGESLADYLDENYRLTVKEALPIFRQVCAGLAYAHDRGIVHRDIKPGNIMLLPEGRENAPPLVKIVDFGIAKLTSFDSGFGQGLTRPGEVFGSPLYMSPEQCAGQQLDHRTDMYSVGVTMFQALTGKPPLLGKTAIETTAMHQSVVPPAMADAIVLDDDEEPVEFPDQLEDIVARLLAKSPDDRYDSLADVASELLVLERTYGRSGGNSSTSSTRVEAVSNSSRSPSAVAGSAQWRPGFLGDQDITVRQSDTDSGVSANKQSKMILIAGASLLLVSGLLAVGVLAFMRPAKVTPVESSKIGPMDNPLPNTSFGEVVNGVEKRDFNDEIAPGSIDKIKEYLKTQKEPYSAIEVRRGIPVRVFQFPPVEIGTLTVPRLGTPPYESIRAQGRVPFPISAAINFHAAPIVRLYPDLLKYFRADEPSEINLNNMPDDCPGLGANLKRFTKMARLELKGSRLKSSDVAWLSELPAVNQLSIDNTGIPGSAFAECKCLPKLVSLGISYMEDSELVLKKLAQYGKLEVLNADFCKLGSEAFGYIGKLKKMRTLTCKDSPITDDDVKQLGHLTNLRELDLSKCNSLTPAALETIYKLKKLEVLSVPDTVLDTDINDKNLRQQLPLLREFN